MRAIALSLSAGVIDFLGFVGFGYFPLTWVAMVPVLWAARDASPRRALLYGWIFGTTGMLGGYYWLGTMLHEFAELPWPWAFCGLLLLCAYQGLELALPIWAARHAERALGVAPLWTLAVVYPAVELCFPLLFPFHIGNSQWRFSAVTQVVELTGLLGLTSLIGLVNGAAYELLDARLAKRPVVRRRLGVTAGAFAAVVLYGLVRLPMIDARTAAAKKLKVAMIQTNFGAKDKAKRGAEFIQRHIDQTREAVKQHPDVELLVWPETAYNRRVPREETDLGPRLGGGFGKPMIAGVLTVEPTPDGKGLPYNSAVATSSSGKVLGRFDKTVLLAFGETIPFVDTFPSIRPWFPHSSVFGRGRSFEHLRVAGTSLLPMICYEDIIPSFVHQMWDRAGPPEALVNLTNDSWYGDSHQPNIHLVLASFRSIETRRALIRSTNTGISALVDPAGRIVTRSGQWTQETIVGEVPLIADGSTPLYLRTGELFGWLALGGSLFGAYRVRRARSKEGSQGSRDDDQGPMTETSAKKKKKQKQKQKKAK